MSARPEYPEAITHAIGEDRDWYAKSYEEAKGGDTSAARDLLHGFCSAVVQKRPIPEPILNYLQAAIDGYLGTKPEGRGRPGPLEKALFLVRGPGKPEGSRNIHIAEGRIYTDTTIAALLHLLVRRGKRNRGNYVRLLEQRCRASERSIERYDAEHNTLPVWTSHELREVIYIERESAKHHLTADERELIQKGMARRISVAERKKAASIRAVSWQ